MNIGVENCIFFLESKSTVCFLTPALQGSEISLFDKWFLIKGIGQRVCFLEFTIYDFEFAVGDFYFCRCGDSCLGSGATEQRQFGLINAAFSIFVEYINYRQSKDNDSF